MQEHYSLEEAKKAIEVLLAPYGETVRITFRETDAEIIDSYLVDDSRVRHAVCEIIAKTGVTERDAESLSAEWRVHNVSYQVGYKRNHAKDVSLDYAEDPRKTVRIATRVFDKLNIE